MVNGWQIGEPEPVANGDAFMTRIDANGMISRGKSE
jgi:hypothetical protein